MHVWDGIMLVALAALLLGFILAMTALVRGRPITLKFLVGPKGIEASFDARNPSSPLAKRKSEAVVPAPVEQDPAKAV